MRRIRASVQPSFAIVKREEFLEFDDDVTDEEINQIVDEWAQQHIEVWWDEETTERTEK